MLHRPMSRYAFSGALLIGLSTVLGSASADIYLETGYFPTSSVLSLSAPAIYPTTYVVPTAFSTGIYPTSSVIGAESVLVPTSSTTIVRRSFFRPRRFIERTFSTYSPTTFVTPTNFYAPTSFVTNSNLLPTTFLSNSYVLPRSFVVDNGVVTTSLDASSYPCETSSTPVPTRSTAVRPSDNPNTITSVPSGSSVVGERRPQGMSNGSMPEEAPSSAVNPAVPAPVNTARPLTSEATSPSSPPAANLLEKDPSEIVVPDPGKSGTKPNETSAIRKVRRPVYDARNIFRGRVISADTRQPEEGVTVILSSATRSYTDRPAMTDADGEFKISLPDGDWTVKVKMPSGSVYPVGRDFVTASNGRVVDANGRGVAEFLITR